MYTPVPSAVLSVGVCAAGVMATSTELEQTMRAISWAVRSIAFGVLVVSSRVAYSQAANDEQAALVAALRGKHIALARGVQAAAANGKPISAKYEYEHGKLQLSVYTEKGGQFTEVIVDHADGKVAKSEKIADGADLAAARSQTAAMAQATKSLAAAIEKALAANNGFSAVKATAALENGKPVAQITLNKGAEFKMVTEPLS